MTLRTPTYLLSSPLNSPPVSHIGDDDVPYPRASCDGDTQQTAAADDEQRYRMADDEDWWHEEDNYSVMDPELILKPAGVGLSLLSLASCGVMATVMLRSSLRRASWTPYMLLWAAAEALVMLTAVVEGVFIKQVNRSHDASFFGCLVYYFVHHSATFLSTASVIALSLDLLLRGLKPSLFGPRCSLHVTLALLVCGLLLYCPIFFIIEARYLHRQVHVCLADVQRSSAASVIVVHMYLHVSLFLVAVPWPTLVIVGLVVLWWKRRQFSEHVQILAAFLLGFLLLMLVSLYHSISDYNYEFAILHYVVLVCSIVKPLVILGFLSTSSDFCRSLKDSFRRPFCRVGRDNPDFMTEMTEIDGDT